MIIIDDVLLRPSTPVSDVSKIALESVEMQTPKRKKGKKKRLSEKLVNKQKMEEISRDLNISSETTTKLNISSEKASETKSSVVNSDKEDENSPDIKNEFEKSSSSDGRASTSVRTETEKELQKSKKTSEKRFVLKHKTRLNN